MGDTLGTLRTKLAYRLGDSSAPSDSATISQRDAWLNEGYRDMQMRQNWWWQEETSIANTNDGTADYTEPTDLKDWIELKISDVFYVRIPYQDNQLYQNTIGVVTIPSLRRSYKFYTFDGTYNLIPTPGNDAAVHYIKYYKIGADLSSTSDEPIIPNEYRHALLAYAEARYWTSIVQQDKAVAPFQEYEQIIKEMQKRHSMRGGGAGYRIYDPEDVLVRT